MSSSKLKIDQDAMETAKASYSKCATDMGDIKTNLTKAVDEIRAGWDSEGGKAFFEKFDDEWSTNFDDYINVITHMSENMDKAIDSYQTVFDEADKLKLK